MIKYFEFPHIGGVSVQYGTVRYLVRASNELRGTRHSGILHTKCRGDAYMYRTELRNVTSYQRTVRFLRIVRILAPWYAVTIAQTTNHGFLRGTLSEAE